VVVAMRVLVTGAKGQVGQVILPGLVGHEVIATDKDTLDVTDSRAVRDAVADCDVVIHLAMAHGLIAWKALPPEDGMEVIRVSNGGTYNVLRAAADFGKRAICASSCIADYYNSLGQYVTENSRPSGGGLYGLSKVWAETMCRELHDDLGARMTVARIGGFSGFKPLFIEDQYGHGDNLRQHEAWYGSEEDLAASIRAMVDVPGPDWSFTHVVGDVAARRWEFENLWLNHRYRPRWGLDTLGHARYDDREELDANGIALVDAAIRGNDPNFTPALRASDPNIGNGLPLRWACRLGHVETVRKLIAAGADVEAFGGDPLRQAAASGSMDTFNELASAGADPSVDDGEAIGWAAAHGHERIVERLLKCCSRKQLSAALYQAAKANRVDIMTMLLVQGADPNIGWGECLRYAIWGNGRPNGGNPKMVRLLLEHGCKQQRRRLPSHALPLMEALQAHGRPEVVKALLEYGADPDDLLTDDGRDAYVQEAVKKGHVEALALIGRDATGKRVTQ